MEVSPHLLREQDLCYTPLLGREGIVLDLHVGSPAHVFNIVIFVFHSEESLPNLVASKSLPTVCRQDGANFIFCFLSPYEDRKANQKLLALHSDPFYTSKPHKAL